MKSGRPKQERLDNLGTLGELLEKGTKKVFQLVLDYFFDLTIDTTIRGREAYHYRCKCCGFEVLLHRRLYVDAVGFTTLLAPAVHADDYACAVPAMLHEVKLLSLLQCRAGQAFLDVFEEPDDYVQPAVSAARFDVELEDGR